MWFKQGIGLDDSNFDMENYSSLDDVKKKKESFNNKFNENCIKYPVHYDTPKYVWNLLPLLLNLSIDSTQKVKFFLIWLSHLFLQYWKHATLTYKKYKLIEELVGFINDLSVTCWICSTQVFEWYLCRIQYNKNCFFTKKYLIPLSSLRKLYHETDCHRFDEYKQSYCGITLGPQSNSRYHEKHPLGVFQRTHSPTHRNVQPWQL